MPMLIDTDVAIHLRDGNPIIAARMGETGAPMISAITLGELEAGAARDVSGNKLRRRLLDAMLGLVPVLPFTAKESAAYGHIVGVLGYDRRKVLDRMIADYHSRRSTAAISGTFLISTFWCGRFPKTPRSYLQTDKSPRRSTR
jgi:predicted nucleic acid-binding protein